jgi:hypothetical protein
VLPFHVLRPHPETNFGAEHSCEADVQASGIRARSKPCLRSASMVIQACLFPSLLDLAARRVIAASHRVSGAAHKNFVRSDRQPYNAILPP